MHGSVIRRSGSADIMQSTRYVVKSDVHCLSFYEGRDCICSHPETVACRSPFWAAVLVQDVKQEAVPQHAAGILRVQPTAAFCSIQLRHIHNKIPRRDARGVMLLTLTYAANISFSLFACLVRLLRGSFSVLLWELILRSRSLSQLSPAAPYRFSLRGILTSPILTFLRPVDRFVIATDFTVTILWSHNGILNHRGLVNQARAVLCTRIASRLKRRGSKARSKGSSKRSTRV
jgi:hypothetical protein